MPLYGSLIVGKGEKGDKGDPGETLICNHNYEMVVVGSNLVLLVDGEQKFSIPLSILGGGTVTPTPTFLLGTGKLGQNVLG